MTHVSSPVCVARFVPARISKSLYHPAADQSTVSHLRLTVREVQLGHTEEKITRDVYRRKGETVRPAK
jgi:hypothetical protein